MKTLNLVYPEKSDIKYQVQKFPDGQQNIVIQDIGLGGNFYDLLDIPHDEGFNKVLIKSRLNNWLDLELISCTVASLRELNQELKIHLYVPYILGARSDRKFEEGGNNYLKDVICPIINSLNFKTVTCIDPHSDVLEACIKGFKKESNLDLVIYSLQDLYFDNPNKLCSQKVNEDVILVSPDAGASKKIYKLAEQIGYKGDIITCSKDRDNEGKLTKTSINKEGMFTPISQGKDFIIIDDICDGGKTFINIVEAIKDLADWKNYNKNNKIYLIITHSIFSKGTDELLKYFDGIYTTNSYKEHNIEKVKALNIF